MHCSSKEGEQKISPACLADYLMKIAGGIFQRINDILN